MIEANLLFVLMIIFVIMIAQSTIYRENQRENFYGCNPTNGCAPCGYPCKVGCPENIIEGYSSFENEECSPMALQYPNGKGCYGNTKNFPNSAMVEYENTYPKCNGGTVELREGFDSNNTYSADYLNNFQIQIKQSCSQGEVDMGDTCVRTGCSLGFERGLGDTSGTCFPQCLPGYETIDGNSGRCYKKCELGYETQGTKCFRPEHMYKKHTMPYTGLTQEVVVTPPHQHVKTINLVKDRNVVDKIPLEVAVSVDPTIPIPTAVPYIPLDYGYGGYGGGYNYGYGYGGYGYGNNLNNTYYHPNNGSSYLPVRRFGSSWVNQGLNVNDVNVIEGFDIQMPSDAPQQPQRAMQPPIEMPSNESPKGSEAKSVATTASVPLQETLPNRDLFLPGDGEGCPYGYSASGDTCYENCPPNYKDIDGVSCARESYVVDRQSYDRGSGVPYRQVRNKYARIFPGN
jgi:hypothetical protein